MAATETPRAQMNTSEREVFETNNDNILKNAPEVIEYGKKASQAWKTADSQNSKGDQLAIFALFHAFHKVSFKANIVDRKGEIEDVFIFDLADLATDPKNADGTRNNKVMSARTNAIAEYIFGISADKVDQAFKNRLHRAMLVVFHFVKLGYSLEQVQLAEKGGKQMLKLPYTALNDPPKPNDKGEIDEEKLDHYNRLKDSFVMLDGTKGKTVAELQRKANPPAERNRSGANNTAPEQKGQAFSAAVKMTVATLQTFTDDDKETDIAIGKDIRLQLWDLHQLLTNYFSEVDPLNKEEEEEFSKKETGTNGKRK